MVFYSSLFYLPQFFQVALGYTPIRSGIFLFPVLVSQTLMSALAVRIAAYHTVSCPFSVTLQGQIVSRTGRYRVNFPSHLAHYSLLTYSTQAITYLGFAVWAVGCGCLSTVTSSTSKALLVFYMLLSGFVAGQVCYTTM